MKDTTNENHLDFVDDNLAINFINTRRMVEGQLTDTLRSDSDVKAWLRRLEVPVAKGPLPFGDGVLLKGARELREIARGRSGSKIREATFAGRAQQIPGGRSESCRAYVRRR